MEDMAKIRCVEKLKVRLQAAGDDRKEIPRDGQQAKAQRPPLYGLQPVAR
jgi:hypothetical protein